MPLHLLPPPRQVRRRPGVCSTRKITRHLHDIGRPEPDAYRLTLAPAEIRLEAATERGLFHAERTLAQVRAQSPRGALPCLQILDWPAYPVRGFYHDVARGKVPTLKTLLRLAETCADLKLNHLELYVEHTFAFKNHPEVWRGSDPLTADDIHTLDARCAELHIDLVPSFSTFGHFYTWIHHKFPELNELERDCSLDPVHYWDRMLHYTLDCQNPRSLELVREIITETRPLFRSRFYNICCDETFDLGQGKNRALAERVGKGRLYVDFLKQIMGIVHACDATPLFWGDIMRHHPELLREIPDDALFLDWDYSTDLKSTAAATLSKNRRPFYVCSGTSAWNRWIPSYSQARANITRLSQHGLAHGSTGYLLTDWGDYGHINALGPTLPLLALGASVAWHPESEALSPKRFGKTVGHLVLGDTSGQLLALLERYAETRRTTWQNLSWCHLPRTPTLPDDWFDPVNGLPNGLFKLPAAEHTKAYARILALLPRIQRVLAKTKPADPLVKDELAVGLLGHRVFEEITLVYYHRTGRLRRPVVSPTAVARRVDALVRDLARVWNKRNRPSDFRRVAGILRAAAATLRSRCSPNQPRWAVLAHVD